LQIACVSWTITSSTSKRAPPVESPRNGTALVLQLCCHACYLGTRTMQTCSVEINSSFYGTPASSTLASWVRHHFPSARVTLAYSAGLFPEEPRRKELWLRAESFQGHYSRGPADGGPATRALHRKCERARRLAKCSTLPGRLRTLGYSVMLCRRVPSTAGRFRIESKMKV
jgi:hypothetical protein